VTGEQHYQLSLGILIETVKWLPGVILLQSQVALLPGFPKDTYLIHITVEQGKIVACMISTTTGLVVQGKRAWAAVEQCGPLGWTLSSQLEQPTVKMRFSSGREQPPTRFTVPGAAAMALWSHSERKVFALVDGARTVEQIARLVGKPSQEVQALLRALAAKGYISFE
jgi:hypothetical protein